MHIRLHTVFTWQHHHMHQQRVESAGHLHSCRSTTTSTYQSIWPAAAAATGHRRRSVHLDCTECDERPVHSVAHLRLVSGNSGMHEWVHTFCVRHHHFLHQQRVGSAGYLYTGRIIVQPVWSATAASLRAAAAASLRAAAAASLWAAAASLWAAAASLWAAATTGGRIVCSSSSH